VSGSESVLSRNALSSVVDVSRFREGLDMQPFDMFVNFVLPL
jgi:hypothetical protein